MPTDPMHQAQQAMGAGDFARAQTLLDKHLSAHPQDQEALYLLGVCAQAQNQTETAHKLYDQILALNPGHFGAHYNLGLLLSGLGQDADAMPHHDAATRLQPAQFWAHVNRGNAQARLGQFEAAVLDYQQALQINPQFPDALTNLGNALKELARFDESLQAHERALQLRPNHADTWVNKAATLLGLRRTKDALSAIEKALVLAPQSATAWSSHGAVLHALRQYGPALESLDRALRIAPTLVDAWHNQGMSLADLGQHQDAVAAYDQVLKLKPGHAAAWFYRGMSLARLKSPDQALQSFEQALHLQPRMDGLRGAILNARMKLCDWRELPTQRRLLQSDLTAGISVGNPLELFSVFDDPALLAQAATLLNTRRYPPQEHLAPATPRPPRGEKIRLGYYSADYKTHPVAQLLVELIEQHDRSRFEVYAYSLGPAAADDPMRQRIAGAFDHFVDAQHLSDAELVQRSREHGIDIAINLSGYTEGHRTHAFAMRIAPVQVSYLGYAGTMSADYIDYLVTDHVVCPEGSQAHYREKLVRLPDGFMPHDSTQAISSQTPLRADQGLPQDAFVFCCFNNHYKITPEVFDIWMRLLHQVPGSVLWLTDGGPLIAENLAREAQTRGMDPARLIYAKRVDSLADHLARYRLADLFIDTTPYNAHTTACDALWAGLPVLTCAGQTFASRVAASLLQSIGLPELITHDPETYEARAVELATQPEALAAIRARLATNRLTTPLFQTEQRTRALEAAYVTMHARQQQGQPPVEIEPKA